MILSVVIPLFNCEEFIADTLRSLYRQGFEESDFEILIVNDGSTDDSISVVEHFLDKYSNIRVFCQPNLGVAAARNRGLEMSRGLYVHFLDADDMMEDNSYVMLRELCASNPDIIKFDSYSLPRGQKPISRKYDRIQTVFSGNTKDYVRKFGFPVSSVFYWFKRDLLIKNHFHFDNFKLGEDGFFCMNVLQHSNCNIIACDNEFYIYVIHGNSAVRNNNKLHLRDVIEGAFELILKIENLSKEQVFPDYCYEPYINSLSEVISTHLLRGAFNYRYVRIVSTRMKEKKLLPLKRNSLVTFLLNVFFRSDVSIWIISFFHRNFYLRCFKFYK